MTNKKCDLTKMKVLGPLVNILSVYVTDSEKVTWEPLQIQLQVEFTVTVPTKYIPSTY
jgi:hypothetical protein